MFDDTIVLHNAKAADSAVYQCEASNKHGTLLANANVMIMSKCSRRRRHETGSEGPSVSESSAYGGPAAQPGDSDIWGPSGSPCGATGLKAIRQPCAALQVQIKKKRRNAAKLIKLNSV